MKPVMEAVRRSYPDQVEVVFHDVKKDPNVARQYGVRLIPTQVFLGPDGSEFFRHQGFYPEEDVLAILQRMGVR
jgi:thioredoxin 1